MVRKTMMILLILGTAPFLLWGCGGSSCQDECQPSTAMCDGNTLMQCGNFDSDSCLEWGNPYSCPGTCQVNQCVGGCTDQCQAGARQCAGTQYQVCRTNPSNGCTEWGPPQTCPTGQTCSGAGQCSDACTDECTSGQKQCVAGQNAFQECDCSGACCEWGTAQPCSGGQSCANGDCVECTNDCSPAGKRECVNQTSYRVCGNIDTDPCFEWSDQTDCQGGDQCANGICGAPCDDECNKQGDRQCTTDQRGYQTCGNYDADPCLEWGDATACAHDEVCQTGACSFNCQDECATGTKRCAGSGYQTCGEFDTDPCTDWSQITECKHSETCSNGVCSTVCADECESGDRECSGFVSYSECGNSDHDPCFDWGPPQRCNLWERCLDGACVIICFNECEPAGTRQCAGDGAQECGDFDYDACLEWGDVEPCPDGTLCTNGQCTTQQCDDECAQEGLRECYLDVGFRVCGQFDSDNCLDWSQVTNCGADQQCVDGNCVTTCQDDCATGEIGCNGSDTRWVCADANGDGCLEKVEVPCEVDEDCLNGSCVGDCTDDGFEDNDEPAAATAVDSNQYGLEICQNDDDWYQVSLDANEGLKVTITFTHANGDLDMVLYRQADPQTPLDTSAGVAGSETVTTEGGVADVYLVKVYGFAEAENGYDMFIDIVPQGECLDDSFEENDQQSEAQFVLNDVYENLMKCDFDDDWYSNYLFQGETFVMDILFTHANGDLDVEIYDGDGTMVATGNSSDDDENITIPDIDEGSYYIRVFGYDEFLDPPVAVRNMYDMIIEYGAPCVDDNFEENDVWDDATPIQISTYTGLTLCANDEDWYSFDVPDGTGMLASITFTHAAQGDLDLDLFDPDGNLVDYSHSVSDNEDVGYDVIEGGTYRLRVTGWDGSENDYDLEVLFIVL